MYWRLMLVCAYLCISHMAWALKEDALGKEQLRCTLQERKNTASPSGTVYVKKGIMNGPQTEWKTPHGYTARFQPVGYSKVIAYGLHLYRYHDGRMDQTSTLVYKTDLKQCHRTLLWVNGHPGIDFDYLSFTCSPVSKPDACKWMNGPWDQ